MNRPNKLHLGQFPTPMHRLDNMSRVLGRNIYIKRDDMTGVSTGGNKVRKLEYLLYDAKEKGADYVLTTGGAQSNHAMLTAACCNKIGIKAILVLKQRGVQGRVGNLLINELLGADVRVEPKDIDILRYYGAGYAQPSKEGLEAITLMAQQEGLILDPVYTGKAFAGLMHLIRTGKIGENETVLFLHSGGTASLFAVDPKDVK